MSDLEDGEIIKLADELRRESDGEREYAVNAFYWVRDKIPFGVSILERAQYTLKKGYGNCYTKSNLLVALLRANKIPARFNISMISGDALKGIVPKEFGKKIVHATVELFIDDRWIEVDCTRDKDIGPAYDWDGYNPTPENEYWLKDIGVVDKLNPEMIRSISREDFPHKWGALVQSIMDITVLYTDDRRYERSGKRAIGQEKIEELMDEAREAGSSIKMEHKGNAKVIFAFSRLLMRIFGKMKVELIEKGEDKVIFSVKKDELGSGYMILHSLLEGFGRAINENSRFELLEANGEERYKTVINCSGKGSILVHWDILIFKFGVLKSLLRYKLKLTRTKKNRDDVKWNHEIHHS